MVHYGLPGNAEWQFFYGLPHKHSFGLSRNPRQHGEGTRDKALHFIFTNKQNVSDKASQLMLNTGSLTVYTSIINSSLLILILLQRCLSNPKAPFVSLYRMFFPEN